jgi:hypothetical protein
MQFKIFAVSREIIEEMSSSRLEYSNILPLSYKSVGIAVTSEISAQFLS